GVIECELAPGEFIRGTDTGGGGYGKPKDRDPARVLKDVREKWETMARAKETYGVVLKGSIEDENLSIDNTATEKLRNAS
ncbi:MAG: hydantoinase, partial [Thiotrichales bacterium]